MKLLNTQEFMKLSTIQNIAMHVKPLENTGMSTFVQYQLNKVLETNHNNAIKNGEPMFRLPILSILPEEILPDDQEERISVFEHIIQYYYLMLTPLGWKLETHAEADKALVCIAMDQSQANFLQSSRNYISVLLRQKG